MLSGVQDGGAISIWGSNNRADLTSCTLSGNQANTVRQHARSGVFQEASVHAAIGDVARLLLRGVWRGRMITLLLFGVQHGGAIVIWQDNNRADLTLCTLSGNIAGKV